MVRAFIGHGVGTEFHTAPEILHYYDPRAATVMEPGMTFTIEPMIAQGAWQHRMWDDDWTAVTVDGRRSAQFEHTIVGHRGRRRHPHPPPRRSLVRRLTSGPF